MNTILNALTGLIITAATLSTANAAEVKTNRYVLDSKAVTQSYNNIVVRGDVDIILVQGTSNQMTLEGYQKQLENVVLNVSGNTLYVNAIAHIKGTKPVVYIPVSDLRYLKVQGNSDVKTLGYLQGTNMVIELASECRVAIKTTAYVSISESSTNDYTVDKWEMAAL